MSNQPASFPADRELVLERVLNATPEKLFRCWTTPELIVQWFTPPPFKTVEAVTDVRAGGASCITMQGPDGQKFPNRGVYLEVIPNRKIVFTDAFTAAWEPSAKPFFTAVLTFDDLGNGQTKYTARARHWTVEDCLVHEKMGFHQGWGTATSQLEALARRI